MYNVSMKKGVWEGSAGKIAFDLRTKRIRKNWWKMAIRADIQK